MAIALRGWIAASSNTTTTFSVSATAGWTGAAPLPGDYLVAWAITDDNADGGRTTSTSFTTQSSGGLSVAAFSLQRKSYAGEASWLFGDGTATASGKGVIVAAFSGVDAVTPIDVTPVGSASISGSTIATLTAPTLITVTAGACLVSFYLACRTDATPPGATFSVPPGETTAGTLNATPFVFPESLAIDYQILGGPGSTGVRTAGVTNGTFADAQAFSVALRPYVAPIPPGGGGGGYGRAEHDAQMALDLQRIRARILRDEDDLMIVGAA